MSMDREGFLTTLLSAVALWLMASASKLYAVATGLPQHHITTQRMVLDASVHQPFCQGVRVQDPDTGEELYEGSVRWVDVERGELGLIADHSGLDLPLVDDGGDLPMQVVRRPFRLVHEPTGRVWHSG